MLGHVIALKAGTDYETLVVDRICRPLKMDSTRITLTPEVEIPIRDRPQSVWGGCPELGSQTQLGGSALRSTANDLLKFLSANLGLTPSSLTPLMEKTHVVHLHKTLGVDLGLAWMIMATAQGTKIIRHHGCAPGYVAVAGFDKTRQRGVVVLCSSWDSDVPAIGLLLLESEWRPEVRPGVKKLNTQALDSCVGQYRLSPDFALGAFILRVLLLNMPRAAVYIPAGLGLTLVGILLWCARSWMILGGAVAAGGLLAVLIVLGLSHLVCALIRPVPGIRRAGERVFVQYDMRLSRLAARLGPPGAALPNITGEPLPESESRFLGRTPGIPMTFSRDGRGDVTRAPIHFLGASISHERISDEPPKACEPLKPGVHVKLDTELLDACVRRLRIPAFQGVS